MENREFELLARRYMDMVFRLAAATVRTRLRRGRELLRAGLEEAKSNV